MQIHQFITSVVMQEVSYNPNKFNLVCNKLTDRMSYLNECLNNYSVIYQRMSKPLSTSTRDQVLKAAANLATRFKKVGESSEDPEILKNANYEILNSFWTAYNAGAITFDNIKLLNIDDTKNFCTDPISKNVQSRIPGLTITIYENVGRLDYRRWFKNEADTFLTEYLDMIEDANDPSHRSYFGAVPYLVPAYGTIHPGQEPYNLAIVQAWVGTVEAFQAMVDVHSRDYEDITYPTAVGEPEKIKPATEVFTEALDTTVADYYKAINKFFVALMDVYTNERFSSGIYA